MPDEAFGAITTADLNNEIAVIYFFSFNSSLPRLLSALKNVGSSFIAMLKYLRALSKSLSFKYVRASSSEAMGLFKF